MPVFDTIELKGRKVEINIDDKGQFVARVDGFTHQSKSLDGLKVILRGAMQKTFTKIPCTLVNDHFEPTEFTDGEIVGTNDHTNRARVQYEESGHPGTLDVRWGSRDLCKRFTKEDRKRFLQLERAHQKAEKDFEDFWEGLKLAKP